MRVIYTSKGMSKSLGCALYIRCALSIEKYGNLHFGEEPVTAVDLRLPWIQSSR